MPEKNEATRYPTAYPACFLPLADPLPRGRTPMRGPRAAPFSFSLSHPLGYVTVKLMNGGIRVAEVLIRYRPSGATNPMSTGATGRGEFEWTPSPALMNKHIVIRVPAFDLDVPAEVYGKRADGKPRLRKDEPNNRRKLHIDALVTSLAKLPESSRSVQDGPTWPLEGKGYVVDGILCEIADEDATTVTLIPRRLDVLGSDQSINLAERFAYVASELDTDYPKHPALNLAMVAFKAEIDRATNSRDLRQAADAVIDLQTEIFGPSNAGSTKALEELESLPETDLEEAPADPIVPPPSMPAKAKKKAKASSPKKASAIPSAPSKTEGREGRLLTRWHAYRERDRTLVRSAKAAFKAKHGHLYCEACEIDPRTVYGPRGEDRLQAHHRTPIEEMMPGAVTRWEDLAMVCPSCHDIIHARRPWISVQDVRDLLAKHRK